MATLAPIISAFVVGVVVIALSIPFLFNKVPRNSIYGFRTKLTKSSDEVWYPANRFAAKGLIIWGVVNIIAGFIALKFQPLTPLGQSLLMATTLSVLIVLVVCLIWVKKKFGHLAP